MTDTKLVAMSKTTTNTQVILVRNFKQFMLTRKGLTSEIFSTIATSLQKY